MFELTFVRHGESNGNAIGISMGHTPGFLTSRGKEQAKMLNLSLRYVFSNSTFDAIYCSDLKRVVETCKIALQIESAPPEELSRAVWQADTAAALVAALPTVGHPNLSHMLGSSAENSISSSPSVSFDFFAEAQNVVYSPLLREKHAGIFEGRPHDEQFAAYKDHGNDRTFCPARGESWEDVQKRVIHFIEMVQEENSFGVLETMNLKIAKTKSRYSWCTGGCFGPKAADVVVPPLKRILVFTSGGVIKEFINHYVYKTRVADTPASAYYPNSIHNCGVFLFRCNAKLSKVKMVIENRSLDDVGESCWEKFMEDNAPQLGKVGRKLLDEERRKKEEEEKVLSDKVKRKGGGSLSTAAVPVDPVLAKQAKRKAALEAQKLAYLKYAQATPPEENTPTPPEPQQHLCAPVNTVMPDGNNNDDKNNNGVDDDDDEEEEEEEE